MYDQRTRHSGMQHGRYRSNAVKRAARRPVSKFKQIFFFFENNWKLRTTKGLLCDRAKTNESIVFSHTLCYNVIIHIMLPNKQRADILMRIEKHMRRSHFCVSKSLAWFNLITREYSLEDNVSEGEKYITHAEYCSARNENFLHVSVHVCVRVCSSVFFFHKCIYMCMCIYVHACVGRVKLSRICIHSFDIICFSSRFVFFFFFTSLCFETSWFIYFEYLESSNVHN